MSDQPHFSSKERDWRAGCECSRAGLCFRCQAAEEIASLQRQVGALSRLSTQAVTEAQREKDARNSSHEPRVAVPEGFPAISDECLADLIGEAKGKLRHSALLELQMRRASQPPAVTLRDLLKPIELDQLIEWHKMCAQCSEQSDDLAGARRHRERRVDLVGIRAGDTPTKPVAPEQFWFCSHGSPHNMHIAVGLCGCERPTVGERDE